MRAGHYHPPPAPCALTDHAEAGAATALRVDPEPHVSSFPEPARQGTADDRHWNSGSGRQERGRRCSCATGGIRDQERRGAGALRLSGLGPKQAAGGAGQGHLAGADAGQVLIGAAMADRAQRSVRLAGAGVDERPEVAAMAKRPNARDPQGGGPLAPPGEAKAREPGAPPRVPKRARHVVGRLPVAARPGRAIAAVPIRDPLQCAEVAQDDLPVDLRGLRNRVVALVTAGLARHERGGTHEHGKQRPHRTKNGRCAARLPAREAGGRLP